MNKTSDYITLSCPACGGKLQISDDIQRFVCAHCRNEHIVRRGGGVVSIAPIVEGLGRVQQGTDRTAAELAIARLTKEIADLEVQLEELRAMPLTKIVKASPQEQISWLLSVLFLLVMCPSGAADSQFAIVFTTMLLFVCVGAALYFNGKRTALATKIKGEALDKNNSALERKRRMLADNRRIVG